MKAILKLKNKKLYLDWKFGYNNISQYVKFTKPSRINIKITKALLNLNNSLKRLC